MPLQINQKNPRNLPKQHDCFPEPTASSVTPPALCREVGSAPMAGGSFDLGSVPGKPSKLPETPRPLPSCPPLGKGVTATMCLCGHTHTPDSRSTLCSPRGLATKVAWPPDGPEGPGGQQSWQDLRSPLPHLGRHTQSGWQDPPGTRPAWPQALAVTDRGGLGTPGREEGAQDPGDRADVRAVSADQRTLPAVQAQMRQCLRPRGGPSAAGRRLVRGQRPRGRLGPCTIGWAAVEGAQGPGARRPEQGSGRPLPWHTALPP